MTSQGTGADPAGSALRSFQPARNFHAGEIRACIGSMDEREPVNCLLRLRSGAVRQRGASRRSITKPDILRGLFDRMPTSSMRWWKSQADKSTARFISPDAQVCLVAGVGLSQAPAFACPALAVRW